HFALVQFLRPGLSNHHIFLHLVVVEQTAFIGANPHCSSGFQMYSMYANKVLPSPIRVHHHTTTVLQRAQPQHAGVPVYPQSLLLSVFTSPVFFNWCTSLAELMRLGADV